MNPFQRAREQAVALRRKLLDDRAGEAVHVSEFLTPDPIAAKLSLGVEYVPKGAAELSNGDAILRRKEDYIYVRKDIGVAEQAYLVAHELGHFILDESQEEVAIASLSSLTDAEGTPAVISVEAYGARERLELRANVFARELMLPREVARVLHDAGVGPRKAARDLGIHLEIVRQQMLDAVMLPNVVLAPEARTQHPPSLDQLLAIQAPERYVNVVAGPGSGKTSTLVHRIRYLIDEKAVDPSHILVLTFTNKAAFELVDRLRDANIHRASDVWAGTFHAFGLDFLRKYHQCFGLESDLKVADRLNAITILNQELPKVELTHYRRVQDPYDWLPDVVNSIKRLKEEMVSPEAYRLAIQGLPTAEPGRRECREDVASLYECYERALRERKMVDFVDLVAKPAKAIEQDRPQYSELADKFQHVLVDEYQDVTHAMVELISQLAKNAKSLWVVGDVRQAIHHWRGASVHSLTKFNERFEAQAGSGKIKTYPLAFNRRSSSEILELVKQAGKRHILETTSLKLENTTATSGPNGHPPTLVSCFPFVSMPDAIAAGIHELHSEGVPFGKQAVLNRWNYELGMVAAGLRRVGIPVLHIGELAQRPEVKTLLCLMQLMVERLPRALVGLMGDARLAVDFEDFQKLMELCEEDPLLQRGAWLDDLPEDLSPQSRSVLVTIARLLNGQWRRSNPWGFVCDLLLEHRFGYPPRADVSIEAHSLRIALWQFAYATRTGDGERKFPTLPRFLLRQQLRQRIGETYSERELPAEVAAIDAVRLLSIHGSKGLEFDSVHVNNVNTDDYGPKGRYWESPSEASRLVPPEVLRSSQETWNFEATVERNNLLYVALSRARKRLFMYQNGEDTRKGAPQLSPPSAPVRALSFNGTVTAPAGQAPIPRPPLTEPLPFDEFETFVRCPLQHWYRFELRLAGEQGVDIAIKARWAVMAALKALAQKPGSSPKEAFMAEWESRKLPSHTEDLQLWTHATAVFWDGLAIIKASAGAFVEPVTSINGLTIRLNWMLLNASAGRPALELIRFSGSDLTKAAQLLRPMLNDLQPVRARGVTIHSLLGAKKESFEPSGAIEKTAAFAAVQRFFAGNREPKVGRHCKRCAYMTFCPTRPSM
ncbi:UvrD/REP helicase [Rhodoferax ferrireducens T118]|uniref:DNA 3'-5' helicase n=1 Tax=Albidiferax ferrireducens (strain ATCC BAA-621 / DSM 15236 / T118) TaxID=338969 RepID=Q21Z66_ALBFT|nr:UvrD-helicase domain-containing protein [Rhodoferax ferrireducens]ABD68937.1 UvrD/REP helicase [Rhodoferax ferrireducens T118]